MPCVEFVHVEAAFELIGTDPSKLKPALDRLFAGQWKRGGIPPLWDGRTGERIVAALERLLAAA